MALPGKISVRVRDLSWRLKLAGAVGILVGAFVSTLVYLNADAQKGFVEKRRLSELESMGRVVREVSLQFIIEERPAELDIIYEEWADQADVLSVDYVDSDNLLLVTGRSGGGDLFLTPVDDPIIQEARDQRAIIIEQRAEYTKAAFPIFLGTKYLGAVTIDYGYESFAQEVSAVNRTAIRTGVLFVCVGLALSIWLASAMSAPLRKLNQASRRAAEGDLQQTIEIHSRDEIGSLAGSLNAMMSRLQERLETLEKTKHELGVSNAEVEARNAALQRALEDAEEAQKIAEMAEEAKTQFVARMSHEIRTPLNGVLGMTELLRTTKLTPEQIDLLDTIQRSGDSLLFVVNDILDFSKIEAGHMTLRKEHVNVEDLLDETAAALAAQPKAKSLELVTQTAVDTPACILGDRVRLKQILVNLAGNAIKFTSDGHVRISVQADRSDPQNPRLRFDVEDSGCGIPEEKLASLFEEFTQVDGSHSRSHEGTGLGLAIARGFVNLMNGRIWVKSHLGTGATFSFEIPLIAVDQTTIGQLEYAPDLEARTVYVSVRSNVLEAALLKRLESWNAAVVFCDLEKPLPRTQETPLQPRPPILIADQELLEAANPAAISDWRDATGGKVVALLDLQQVAKDISATGVVNATALKPLSARRLAAALEPSTQPKLPASSANDAPFPPSKRQKKVLLVDDNATNRKIVELILKRQDIPFETAVDGQDAVEKFQLFAPDVVLMDISMPVMDGFDATKEIRKIESANDNGNCQIIGLTAHSTEDDRAACLAAGMNEHVAKPVKMATIKKLVAS